LRSHTSQRVSAADTRSPGAHWNGGTILDRTEFVPVDQGGGSRRSSGLYRVVSRQSRTGHAVHTRTVARGFRRLDARALLDANARPRSLPSEAADTDRRDVLRLSPVRARAISAPYVRHKPRIKLRGLWKTYSRTAST